MKINVKYGKKIGTNKFVCYSYDTKLKDNCITCIGLKFDYPKDIPLEIYGEYKDKEYICEYALLDMSEEHMVPYLRSSQIKNFGIRKAKKFLKMLKEEKEPEEISKEINIDINIIKDLYIKIKGYAEKFSLYSELNDYHISLSQIEKMYEIFGEKLKDMIFKNPYKCCIVAGINYAVAEQIACDRNIQYDSEVRCQGIILEIGRIMKNSGSTYIRMNEIEWLCNKIQSLGIYKQSISPYVIESQILMMHKFISFDEGGKLKVCLYSMQKKEESIATHLKRLNTIDTEAIDYQLNNTLYDGSQISAIKGCMVKSGIRVITGGPGTGKTTVIKAIIDAHTANGRKCVLCAPTGRAAARITESSGYNASTIHRLLGIKPIEYEEVMTDYNVSNPLPYDVMIIDESSMVGIDVLYYLLPAIKDNTLLILVGDADQLPSVEAGNVFDDIIKSRTVPVYKLTTIHRQSAGNSIILNSRKVIEGDFDLISDKNTTIRYFLDENELIGYMNTIFKNKYNPNNPYSLQILTTVKKGLLGKNSLNKDICEIIHKGNESLGGRYFSYYKNDKIMTIKNNYENNYMNGDIGNVIKTDSEGLWVKINNEDILINELGDIEHAYVATVHKSQGSEYDNVVLVLTDEFQGMLNRNIVYTAMTRAKKHLDILVLNNALEIAITNARKQTRLTRLKYLLQI